METEHFGCQCPNCGAKLHGELKPVKPPVKFEPTKEPEPVKPVPQEAHPVGR